jgi:ATP-dependent exoDNAse (exonuclease V) beta subunit
MVAGQIDAVFVGHGEYHMVDWKRCARRLEPMFGECFHRYGKYPFDALLDNPCSHYFVQQNLYAVILERRYGMRLRSMHLVQIHPEFETYLVVEVPDLRCQAAFILDKYAKERRRDAIDWEIAEAGG